MDYCILNYWFIIKYLQESLAFCQALFVSTYLS
jgi:hypothetical protein